MLADVDMEEHLTRFRDALESGNPDQVNPAIEELEEMDLNTKAEWFDELFEMCIDLYEEGDGYQRQSVVRFVRELVPRRRLMEVFERAESETDLPEHLTPGALDEYMDRVEAFYVAAMDDDDGRVRLAAIKGLEHLALAYRMTGQNERIEKIHAQLTEMATDASDKKREHLQRALQQLQLREGPSLEEILSTLLNSNR